MTKNIKCSICSRKAIAQISILIEKNEEFIEQQQPFCYIHEALLNKVKNDKRKTR